MADSLENPVDPEVQALLDFAPVTRRCRRHDGWTPEVQRAFIAALVELGSPWEAAIEVGRTESGAYKVRTSAGGEGFATAWDGALALYHRRNPRREPKGRPSRGEILAGTGRRPWPEQAGRDRYPVEEEDPEEKLRKVREFRDHILDMYRRKLMEERDARLDGRIVEADYSVRQLTCIEVMLDLGGEAAKLLPEMERNGFHVEQIVATPMSLQLGEARRAFWREKGEPERPAPTPLGEHDWEVATGPDIHHRSDRDGDYGAWRRRQEEDRRLAAQAQLLWEETARAEAEAWAAREAGKAAGDGEALP
jgi:hypothetical protein